MDYEKQKAQWKRRREAIHFAHVIKGKSVRDIANAYNLTTQRVSAIIRAERKSLK